MTRDVYRSTFGSPVCLKPVFTLLIREDVDRRRRPGAAPPLLSRRGWSCGRRPSDVKAFVLKFAELNHETYLAAKKQTVAGKEKKSIVG